MTWPAFTQLSALIGKDLKLRRRSWIVTLLELFGPIMIIYSSCHIVKETLPKKPDQKVVNNQDLSILIGRYRIPLKMYSNTVYYTPNSSDIDSLVNYLIETIKEFYHKEVEFIYFPSEDDFPTNFSADEYNMYKLTGLVFDPSEPTLNFKIRISLTLGIVSDSEKEEDPDQFLSWDQFNTFHWIITSSELEDSILQERIQNPPWYDTFERASPVPKMGAGPLASILQKAVKLPLGLANMLILAVAVKRIVSEKQKGSKELLRMMGVADWTYWLEQFINYLPLFLIQAPIMTYIIYDVFEKRLLKNVHFLLFTSMTLILFISNLLMSFTVTTMIASPILAQMAVLVAIFYGSVQVLEKKFNIFYMFVFPVAHFSTWLDNSIDKSTESEYSSIIHFLFIPYWILYILLILYIDAVWPWQSGTVKPWNFPCRHRGKRKDPSSVEYHVDCDPKMVEESSGEAGIICYQLRKVYTLIGGGKLAVDNLSMKIIKNQITVLLGHNGAGKTTLMSMITGFISPTSGMVYVNGFNVQKDTLAARRSLALCPQHECLYENLTVQENFKLCANLRQADSNIVSLTLRLLQLEIKSSTLASKLSGGMRRRVQLGMALVTDSDTLILDEPTSGLDPETRRSIWDYLILLREKKTILITTHFMEEAEALADQIIIMSGGRIKCIGSQIFLKTRLGAGYSVRFSKKSFDQDSTVALIGKYFPKASIANDTKEEITYNLNVDSEGEKSPSFLDNIAELCDSLEEKKEEIGIFSFTIATATLEDVFMKVAVDEGLVEEDRVTFAQVKDTTLVELQNLLDSDKQKLRSRSFCQCYYGLLCKRWNYFSRDYRYFIYSSIVPIAVIFLTLNTFSMVPASTTETKNFSIREISPNFYAQNSSGISIVFSGSDNSSLRECFSTINEQYDVDKIIVNETVYDYLSGKNQSIKDGAYLFGIQDQGSIKDVTLFGTSYYSLSKPIVVSNYLNILRCVQTGESTLIQVKDHRFPESPTYATFLFEAVLRRIMNIFLLPITFAFLMGCFYTFPATENQVKVCE